MTTATLCGAPAKVGVTFHRYVQRNRSRHISNEHSTLQSTIPGYAGLGGSGCYANHIDLIRNDDDEEQLKKVEDQLDPGADDEEAVEAATYELSKHHIADEDGEERDRYEDEESDRGNDAEQEAIEEDLQMIDVEEDDQIIRSDWTTSDLLFQQQ